MNSGNAAAPVKGPIVLNQQQSAQLMERLKQQNKQLQTTINPQTGEKRIYISATTTGGGEKKLVAIPLQPSTSSSMSVVSAAPQHHPVPHQAAPSSTSAENHQDRLAPDPGQHGADCQDPGQLGPVRVHSAGRPGHPQQAGPGLDLLLAQHPD